MPSLDARQRLIAHLKSQGIMSVFHYVPLHLSDMGKSFGGRAGQCPVTEDVSDRLLRLPFYTHLTESDQAKGGGRRSRVRHLVPSRIEYDPTCYESLVLAEERHVWFRALQPADRNPGRPGRPDHSAWVIGCSRSAAGRVTSCGP